MSLVAAEGIKLTSTRSPWWGAALAITVTVGVTSASIVSEGAANVAGTQVGYALGMAVIMVIATLAVTTEYAVGTIRTTFLAAPRRTRALTAKTVVVASVSGLIGLIIAFSCWGVAQVLSSNDLSLAGGDAWRQVAGVGVVYVGAAMVALAVGILVRHTAGAVSLVLVWTLIVEQLLSLIPGIGPTLQPWLPFQAAKQFLTSGSAPTEAGPMESPWVALAYFAVFATALLGAAFAVANRRDA